MVPCIGLNLENINTKRQICLFPSLAVSLVGELDMSTCMCKVASLLICWESLECCGNTTYSTKSRLEGLRRLSKRIGVQAENEG